MAYAMSLMTERQKDLIEAMNEFCREQFDMSFARTKEEARAYISRNFEEYKLQSTVIDRWNATYGQF